VLASRYRRALASSRGILITRPGPEGTQRRVLALAEKPGLAEAIALEDAHGAANLLMLEGRARLTGTFIEFARARQDADPRNEPKLAFAISAYAREHSVFAVPCEGEIIDLGASQALPRQAPAPAITRSIPVS
jgi:UTP-glucose-1-phosphate uridylyltransferase